MRFSEDIYLQVMYFPRAIVLMFFMSFAYMFVKENDPGQLKQKMADFIKRPWELLFVLYLSFLIISTLISRWPDSPYGNVFNHFGLFDENGWNYECIENVLLFIPYTFLYLMTSTASSPWKSALILSLCSTVFIEFSQLIFWLGQFQISDMLHNVIGGMIGCCIWYAVREIKRLIVRSEVNT